MANTEAISEKTHDNDMANLKRNCFIPVIYRHNSNQVKIVGMFGELFPVAIVSPIGIAIAPTRMACLCTINSRKLPKIARRIRLKWLLLVLLVLPISNC